jgi:hypothetical protein
MRFLRVTSRKQLGMPLSQRKRRMATNVKPCREMRDTRNKINWRAVRVRVRMKKKKRRRTLRISKRPNNHRETSGPAQKFLS